MQPEVISLAKKNEMICKVSTASQTLLACTPKHHTAAKPQLKLGQK
jgi:hypothetical protein